MNRAILIVVVIAVILVGAVASIIAASTFYTSNKIMPAYTAPISTDDSNPTSMTVSTVSGQITLVSWDQAHVSINSTVTSHGMGTNPDAITFDQSNTGNMIVYRANFPSTMGFFGALGYSVDINIYVPNSANFGTVELGTTNGNVKVTGLNSTSITLSTTHGNIQVSNVESNTLQLSTTNGNVDFTCTSTCDKVTASSTNGGVTGTLSEVTVNGTYTMSSTNGNVALKVPSTSSFKLSAHTTNGRITTTGIGFDSQANHDVTTTIGSNPQKTTVTLTTTNGSVTVTGT